MIETPSSLDISTKLEQIAKLANDVRDAPLFTLAHHIDVEWLREAFRRTRKNGATGIDRQTAAEYEVNLEANLQSLLDRAKSGRYRAPPVRRVYIPKGDGSERPLGIPTFEDKVLQRAVAMVLGAVYEQSFFDFSFGFRPGRSAHMALHSLQATTVRLTGGWIVEVDIKKFFDTVDHSHLRTILHQRIRDGVLLRLIGKWLNAGIVEGGQLSHPDEGTPQGGVISPLLANIYLHEVLDSWFATQVWPTLQGRAAMARYADDFVVLFTNKQDAQRFLASLPERFGKYGLTLHPEKTRLLSFRRPDCVDNDDDRPGTFNFLGFTHYWGLSRNQKWVVKKKTAKDRFSRALHRVHEWCRRHRHDPLEAQHRTLSSKLRGHYEYYGVSSNYSALVSFLFWVVKAWWLALSRRSQRDLTWKSMRGILQRHPLPSPYIAHRYST
jgi:group II intron reverse transcriptase/maturase